MTEFPALGPSALIPIDQQHFDLIVNIFARVHGEEDYGGPSSPVRLWLDRGGDELEDASIVYRWIERLDSDDAFRDSFLVIVIPCVQCGCMSPRFEFTSSSTFDLIHVLYKAQDILENLGIPPSMINIGLVACKGE